MIVKVKVGLEVDCYCFIFRVFYVEMIVRVKVGLEVVNVSMYSPYLAKVEMIVRVKVGLEGL